MSSLILSPDSRELPMYYYPRILGKKKNRTIHTWATRICENIPCSHSSQLAHHWLVSKLWKETSRFVYVHKLCCFLSASLVPISHFSTGSATKSSFIAIVASDLSCSRSSFLKSLLPSDNNTNKRKSPRTRPSSQCQYHHYSENRSHSATITINLSPFYWQMFHLNKHNQDLGRFTLAAAKMHE